MPGEKSTSFQQFVSGLADDIMSDQLPEGQTPVVGMDPPAMFIPSAQRVLFRVINMVIDMIDVGFCPKKLHEDNIVITEYFEIAKLLMDNLEPSSDEAVERCVKALGEMLDRVVTEASKIYMGNKRANPEFRCLLGVLENYERGDDLYLARFPACFCPLANRTSLYVSMYDFIISILKFADQQAYSHVVAELDCPPGWPDALQNNTQVAKAYKRGYYDPTAKDKRTDPRLDPLRAPRNGHAHPYDDTFDPNAYHGMTVTREQIAHAFYYASPWLTCQMQVSLHYLGELRHLKTELLFAHGIEQKACTRKK
nr:uncharacterized protein LOC127305323 [Lolium perenne]